MPYRWEHNPYQDWPFAGAYVLDSLNPLLIETHATAILSRALNIGRVVAFVGAGTSMSYGRISWKSLVDTESRIVLKEAEDALRPDALHSPSTKDVVRQIRRTLNELQPQRADVRPERYPIIFQLCEQLDKALAADHMAPRKRTERKDTRRRAMDLTVDDLGHALQILKDAEAVHEDDASEYFSSLHQEEKLDEMWNRICLQIYSEESLQTICDIDKCADANNELNRVCEIFVQPKLQRSGKNITPLLPIYRFVLGIALRFLPKEQRVAALRTIREKYMTPIEPTVAAPSTARKGFSRHEFIPRFRDPLLLLQERLQIGRFLTTNYDHEIDRMLIDQGFVGAVGQKGIVASPHAGGPMHRTFSTTVFEGGRAGDLVAFSAQDRSRSCHVVHLHGRAEPSGINGNIVATEADYQRLYVRTDNDADLDQDAIRLAFGANPILFVGSNMGEDDILRPLREFMETPTRVGDRASVALIPGKYGIQYCTEEKVALLGRFGVFAIHFGTAAVRQPLSLITDEHYDKEHAFWLPWVLQVTKALSLALAECEALESNRSVHLTGLKNAIAEIKGYLLVVADPSATADKNAKLLGRPLGLHWEPGDKPQEEEDEAWRRHFIKDPQDPNALPTLEIPTILEGIPAVYDGNPDVDREVRFINVVLSFLNSLPLTEDGLAAPQFVDRIRRIAAAYDAGLRGVENALLATFTCARLIRARWDWDEWRKTWSRRPSPRNTRSVPRTIKRGSNPYLAADFALIDTHSLDHWSLRPDPAKGERGAPYGRFYQEASEAESFCAAPGRRFLLVATRRGIGKGHFFSALQAMDEKGYLEHLLRCLRKETSLSGSARGRVWRGLAFFNLSFAHEVMSVFDRLADFLEERLRDVSPASLNERGWGSLARDRTERLRLILRCWADYGKSVARSDRVLVAINSLDLLFSREGKPKNFEITQVLNVLLEEQSASAPIDFLFVIDEDRVPNEFCDFESPVQAFPLKRVQTNEKSRVTETERFSRLFLSARPQLPAIEEVKNGDRPQAHVQAHNTSVDLKARGSAIFFLHETRAVVLASAFFPRIATLLARNAVQVIGSGNWKSPQHYPAHFYQDVEAYEFREAMYEILSKYREVEGEETEILPARIFVPIAMVGIAVALEDLSADEIRLTNFFASAKTSAEHRTTSEKFIVCCLDGLWNLLNDIYRREILNKKNNDTEIRKYLCGGIAKYLNQLAKMPDRELASLISGAASEFDRLMRRLYQSTGRNRFAITLLLAAAYEISTELTWTVPSAFDGAAVPVDAVTAVSNRIHRFLERVIEGLTGASDRNRPVIAIDQSMSLFNRHHMRGQSLPMRLNVEPKGANGWIAVTQANTEMFELMKEVIWHLAIIGQPIDAEVLAICPRISDAAVALLDLYGRERTGRDAAADCQYVVKEVLALAVNRCLVFRVKSIPPETDAARYTVHRLIQRYVFSQMGAPDIEYAEADQFTVSLFASQPDDLPRISLQWHRRIMDTIAALSAYADSSRVPGAFPPSASPRLKAAMLRAAYGIMRSVYSVGVLARFDISPDQRDGGEAYSGHLEDYRRIVRWVLTTAAAMETGTGDDQPIWEKGDGPFYAEEIVWLYNECGVLSLMQGSLADAHFLFAMALAAAKEIEPNEDRPLHVRILINKAVVDIERGHAAEARQYLERIITYAVEKDTTTLIAQGYLGLIEHLAGNAEVAKRYYLNTIQQLTDRRASRAAAIFSMHLGDLLRALAVDTDLALRTASLQKIDAALSLAQEGCHEDVRHLALLARAQHWISFDPNGRASEIHNDLDEADRYARVVGMPRITTQVSALRARLLMKQGETRLASALARQSLEIACTHDLRVRKMNALLLLSDIYMRRRQYADARPVVHLGERLAKSYGCHFAVTEIQKLQTTLQGLADS